MTRRAYTVADVRAAEERLVVLERRPVTRRACTVADDLRGRGAAEVLESAP